MNSRLTLSVITVMTCVLVAGSSALANEVPLELYPEDASDECIAGSRQIRVTIKGVTKVGIMKLELYDQADGFLRKKARRRWIRDAAQDGPQLMCVNVPAAGEYAISGYHDIDGNRKLKKTWNFRPREPFGLSNNPEYKKSMPEFKDSAFYVGKTGADITLKLVDYQKLKAQRKVENK